MGLVWSAWVAATPIIQENLGNPSYTNCPQPLYGCNIYLSEIGPINPFCCSETATSCTEYSVETWQCEAGGTGYKNFKTSWGPTAGFNCGTGPACF